MKSFEYLPKIHQPSDLRGLSTKEIAALRQEIRAFLVEQVTKTGGHLASNLGVVELTLAIHRVFDSPKDHIIFDVGHQAYVHKMLTGRINRFPTLRQNGGLSGFTKRSESPHDPFGAGHASTSLSAAIGMATADRMRGSDAYTVCVIGDGAFTGGMIHEALNNVKKGLHLIIILNENEMSISHNTGRFAEHLSLMRSTAGYYDIKNNTRDFLRSLPVIGEPLFEAAKTVKKSVKNLLYHSNYFEDLGLYYLGPIDGNDFETTETILRVAKESKQSVLIHVKTQKGKGYLPAETAPDAFHAVPAMKYYHTDTKPGSASLSYSEVFGHTLLTILEKRDDIRVITAAMTVGTGLRCVAEARPEYLSDVGIAEGHAITYAAGLAAGGIHPVAAIYSSFLQRSYDNLIHDAALQHLPMTLCIDRAGFNEGDGVTHHGIFDVAMLSELPEVRICAPLSYDSLRRFLHTAVTSQNLTAIRYPKGEPDDRLYRRFLACSPSNAPLKTDYSPITDGEQDVLIVTYGRITAEAIKAKDRLAEESIAVGVVLLEELTPYETRAAEISALLSERTCGLLFLEEGIYRGGAGMILRDALSEICYERGIRTEILAVRDPFIPSEAGKTMAETTGLDALSVSEAVRRLCRRQKACPNTVRS